MKIFDFTSGAKGRQLADIKRADRFGGWLVEKNGATYKVDLVANHGGPNDQWDWHSSAEYFDRDAGDYVEIRPENFNVEAICFCLGEVFHQWHAGHPDAISKWEWTVIGTTEWNRNACKSGILKATKKAA
jgi:hypothetical protein